MGIFTSVALGWLGRRVLDWGGWLGTFLLAVVGLYNMLPASSQTAVQAVLSGRWQDITLGALLPLGALIFSQVASFRATVKPQVVTPDGNKVAMKELPKATQTVVEEKAETVAAKRPTIKDIFARRPN